MLENRLKQKLDSQEISIGLCNMYPSSGIVEGMCMGWDFVWVDGQHGEHMYESILHACQAAGLIGVDVLLRVPSWNCEYLGNYMDLAPSAIMVPMVDTADQAKHVVEHIRFPPLGNRSFGGRRVIDLEGREYYRQYHVLFVAQVETIRSVENATEIIQTEGVDGLFFGPDDMKVQMNLPVNTPVLGHPDLRKAMERTAAAAREAGKFCGCVIGNEQDFEPVIDMGYRLVVGGGDNVFMKIMSRQRLEVFRNIIGKRA